MKLLTRTVRNYVIFSVLLLVVCTPLFYFFIQRLFIHKMDQELLEHKIEFSELALMLKTENDLKFFSMMNEEFILTPTDQRIETDSLLTIPIYNEEEKEIHPYRVLRTGTTIQGKPYRLQIQESMVSTADLISAIVTIQATLIALLLLGLVLINRKLSRTIWDPFYIILDKLKKYQIDKDSSLDLPRSTTAEFRDLSSVISQLVNKNHEAFQSQKEFTENASHELQTPLAVIKGKIDMLMQTQLSEKQAELIYVMQDAAGRMARLNRNLLLLAKIENQQFLELESINLPALVEKLVAQFSEQLEQKHISLEMGKLSPFSIKADGTMIEVLFTNLLTNAIRYSPSSSSIRIVLEEGVFSISNKGEALHNPDKIFDRFQRDVGTSHGSGIGLAIVKRICDNNGYTVQYTYQKEAHTFTVNFGEYTRL
jgi:signal transduction histidine kinase